MHFSFAHCVGFLAFANVCLSTGLLRTREDGSMLKLTHIASVIVTLGKPLPPVPVPGGVRLIEPITGGNITGSALNATIQGGLAYPTLVSNQTVQNVEIVIYGITDDGQSFFIREDGVGSSKQQVTRINLEAGGRYAYLASEYIVTTVEPTADRTAVNVEAFVATVC